MNQAIPTTSMPGEQLLTVKEVATRLGLTPTAVVRYCQTWKLPAIRVGKEYRIRQRDLEAWYQEVIAPQAKPTH